MARNNIKIFKISFIYFKVRQQAVPRFCTIIVTLPMQMKKHSIHGICIIEYG